MKVPLILDLSAYDGIQYLKFWSNGETSYIRSPLKPFCYAKAEPPMNACIDVVEKRLLYNPKEVQKLFKCSFNTTYEMKDTCGDCTDFYEARFNFKDRIYTCCPELIAEHANDKPLKLMCFDIETDTYGKFPEAEENAIIAIGLQVYELETGKCSKIKLLLADKYDDDKQILEEFFDIVDIEDPDVFVVFNGIGFDFPYMFTRMDKHKISRARFSRDNKTMPWVNNSPNKKEIKIGGRIIYDLYYRSVDRDQNLFKWSPPNRRMKTVAKLYGLDDVVEEPQEIMANMRAMVGNPELAKYLTSDIRCTKFLCDIYIREIINMAETIGVSLESCINSTPAYIGHMLFAREYERIGIVSDMTVGDAHPDLATGKQGAYVGCFKPGTYKKGLKKKDVQSYYPNLVRTLNLSPETCHIIGVEPKLRPYDAHMDHENKYLTLAIPDEKLKKQLIIGIDFSRRGFASTFVDKAMTDRLSMKKQMKMLDEKSPEYADLDVNQLGLKVIMNSITGYYGQEYSMFGSLACYCAITGTGRYLISKLIEFLGGVIALDTDGVVTDDNISIEDTNVWLEKYVLDFFQVPKNYIQLELENFEAAYFRPKSKQYLLIERNKKGVPHLAVHGISFKGSNLPKLFSTIIYDMGFKMLMLDDNDKEAVKEFDAQIAAYYDRSNWSLDIIAKNNTCKPFKQYKGKTALGAQLVQQYENRFKTSIKVDTQLAYVKVKRKQGSKYQLVTIFDNADSIIDLDLDYYEKIVDSAFERLDLLSRTPKAKKAGKQQALTAYFNFDEVEA